MRQVGRIIVNSLGECFQEQKNGPDKCLYDSSVNIREVAENHLTAEQFHKYSEYQGKRFETLDSFITEACAFEMTRQALDILPLPVFDFWHRVTNLQILNDSRFRVWGFKKGSKFNNKEEILLATEFLNFVDEEEFWNKLNAVAKAPYKLEILHERLRTEMSKTVNAIEWNYGPNHNRLERQVEFSINLTPLLKSRNHLSVLIEERQKMKEITEEFWHTNGVGVC